MQIDSNPWADLEDDAALEAATKATKPGATETFPCGACNGTGRWGGGVNRHGNSKCNACRGTGHFKTSQGDRMKAKAARQDKKQADKMTRLDAFNEQHPGLHLFLSKASDWSEFAASLSSNIAGYGGLTDRQLAAAQAMRAKVEARRAEGSQAQQANSGEVDLAVIREMFDTAKLKLKRPVYRAEGMILSLAPDHGKNPGAIYVKAAGDTYLGKVLGTSFSASRAAGAETLSGLKAIAENPLEAAVRYGRLTGSCACCGRELTDPKSVERGIGPVCASNWGF